MPLNNSIDESAFDLSDAKKLNRQIEELYHEFLKEKHLNIHHKAHLMELLKLTYNALAQGKYADAGEYLNDLTTFAERFLGEEISSKKLVQSLWKMGRYINRIGDRPNWESIAG